MRMLLAAAALAALSGVAHAQTAVEAVIYIIDAAEPNSVDRNSDWTFEETGKTLNAYRTNNEKKPFSLREVTQVDGCKYRIRWGSDYKSRFARDLGPAAMNEFTLDFSRLDVERTTMHQADKYRRYVLFPGLRICAVNDKNQIGVASGDCGNNYYAHPEEPERKAKAARHLMANFCKARGF